MFGHNLIDTHFREHSNYSKPHSW